MTSERVGLILVAIQAALLVVLVLIEEYYARRRERDNAATRESNKAAIAAIRQHFPRWQDDINPEELGI